MNDKRPGIFNFLILTLLICIGMGVAMLPLLTRDEQTPFHWMSALLALSEERAPVTIRYPPTLKIDNFSEISWHP